MRLELITKRNDLVIRRMVLDPGEPMFWHRYACHRFTVVVRGSRLTIEYRDIKKTLEFEVHAGMADWDEPEQQIHRAVNTGNEPNEEVVTFYRSSYSRLERTMLP
jgi:hypothetical protein